MLCNTWTKILQKNLRLPSAVFDPPKYQRLSWRKLPPITNTRPFPLPPLFPSHPISIPLLAYLRNFSISPPSLRQRFKGCPFYKQWVKTFCFRINLSRRSQLISILLPVDFSFFTSSSSLFSHSFSPIFHLLCHSLATFESVPFSGYIRVSPVLTLFLQIRASDVVSLIVAYVKGNLLFNPWESYMKFSVNQDSGSEMQ